MSSFLESSEVDLCYSNGAVGEIDENLVIVIIT